jgi:hypothetical protein
MMSGSKHAKSATNKSSKTGKTSTGYFGCPSTAARRAPVPSSAHMRHSLANTFVFQDCPRRSMGTA